MSPLTPTDVGATPPLENGEPATGLSDPSSAMWNTAIVSEPWLTAKSSVWLALTASCWSASRMPLSLRSAAPEPPVEYRPTSNEGNAPLQ